LTLYLDTSALVKLYLDEEGHELVIRAVDEAPRVTTSTVAYAETRAAFARRNREGTFDDEEYLRAITTLDEDWRDFTRLAVSNLVAYRAGTLAEQYALRGFDAIHLASAVRLEERFEDLRFLVFDERLTDAARRVIPVYEER